MIASGFAFRFNNEVTSSDVDKPLCYAQPYLNTSRKLAHQICKSPYVAFLSALGVNFTLVGSEEARFPFEENRRVLCVFFGVCVCVYVCVFVYCFEYGEHLHGEDPERALKERRLAPARTETPLGSSLQTLPTCVLF